MESFSYVARRNATSKTTQYSIERDKYHPHHVFFFQQAIWRQAMQYHQMLKQKHEAEANQMDATAKKRKEIEEKVNAEKKKIQDAKDQELAAERAAQELIKEEERKKGSKKAFAKGGAMKAGFLDGDNKDNKKKPAGKK